MSVYALLIGINEYAGNVPNLSGCHNDVERFEQVLKTRFSVTDETLQVLKSQQATKANIIAGFTDHLSQAGKGDTALVYYSGHGSQEYSPQELWNIEADGQNETIVCHDSRTGAGDLADKELRFLIAGLAEKQPHILVVFDCCHSGSGTRSAGSVDDRAVRLTSPDNRPRAIDQYVFYDTARDEGWLGDMRRLPRGQHIILSACRDSELSKELVIEGRRHGAFTHFLCKTLESAAGSFSYRNLVSRINQQVQALVDKQHPQVEGILGADVNTLFLGEDIQPVKRVVTARNNQWWLDAGAIHGMRAGDQLAVFTNPDDEMPLAIATITSVESEKSVLELDTALDKTGAYQADVVVQARPKLMIEMLGDEEGVRVAREVLGNMEGIGKTSSFVEEGSGQASYRLIARNNRYTLSLAIDEKPLFKPVEGGYLPVPAKKVLRQLEHMAKWQHKLELDNDAGRPADRIADDAVQLVVIHKGSEFVDTDVTLQYQQQGNRWVAPKFALELRLNPDMTHPKPLYCALLFFNPLDGSIQSATTNGVWLRSRQTVEQDSGASNVLHARPVIKVFEGENIEAFVDDILYRQGVTESRDILKLIVSEKEFNASLLEQEGLEIYDQTLDPLVQNKSTRGGDALQTLLDEAMQYTNTRGLRRTRPRLADWMTKATTLTTVRPLQGIEIPDDVITELGLGVEIEPHPLRAVISLESQTQVNRGLEAVNKGRRATPIALQDNRLTPALSLAASATRGTETDLSVISLGVLDDASIQSVTTEQPLVISLKTALSRGEHVLPFAFDGEIYYPLGHAVTEDGKTRIRIESLPDSSQVSPETAAVMAKGLGHSLKLYFQKVVSSALKLEKDTVRLAIPVYDSESPTEVVDYNDQQSDVRAKVAAAETIVVFIHGIIGETRSMAGVMHYPLEGGRSIQDQYDLVLCFDYENLNTPIQETARQFKQKLQEAGLTEGHGKTVHIVAHSMGGLVSRWMVEMEGGNKLVSKLVMLGTPNNGSPWAGVKDLGVSMVRKWAYGSLTLILNGLTTVPVGGLAVAGMMKLIDSVDDTLDQMAENSDFTQSLYQAPDPQIPYYLVAGDTEKLRVDDTGAEEKGYKKIFRFAAQRSKLAAFDVLSQTLFAENNDVAVKVSSMAHIKPGRTPALDVQNVVSDHMSYFVTADSVTALDKALRA